MHTAIAFVQKRYMYTIYIMHTVVALVQERKGPAPAGATAHGCHMATDHARSHSNKTSGVATPNSLHANECQTMNRRDCMTASAGYKMEPPKLHRAAHKNPKTSAPGPGLTRLARMHASTMLPHPLAASNWNCKPETPAEHGRMHAPWQGPGLSASAHTTAWHKHLTPLQPVDVSAVFPPMNAPFPSADTTGPSLTGNPAGHDAHTCTTCIAPDTATCDESC